MMSTKFLQNGKCLIRFFLWSISTNLKSNAKHVNSIESVHGQIHVHVFQLSYPSPNWRTEFRPTFNMLLASKASLSPVPRLTEPPVSSPGKPWEWQTNTGRAKTHLQSLTVDDQDNREQEKRGAFIYMQINTVGGGTAPSLPLCRWSAPYKFEDGGWTLSVVKMNEAIVTILGKPCWAHVNRAVDKHRPGCLMPMLTDLRL